MQINVLIFITTNYYNWCRKVTYCIWSVYKKTISGEFKFSFTGTTLIKMYWGTFLKEDEN